MARWLQLPPSDRSRLGECSASAQLGRGAVLGHAVWDVQSSIRLHIRARTLDDYVDFLPGGRSGARLVALLRTYLGWELQWDLRLALAGPEVPPTELGRRGRLGWSSWLGGRARSSDANDLVLDYEGRAEYAVVAP